MNVTQLFTQINSAYRGSDDDPPTTGTDFELWLATANRKQDEWCRDTQNKWRSLWGNDNLASVVAASTQDYNLGAVFLEPSDKVIVTVGSNTYEYVVVQPQERDRFANSVYISGQNPQVLTFVDPITATSPIVGGTITVAGYALLADLTAGGDTILVDDPYWLALATASELAFNDITYSDKSPDLNNKANARYAMMAKNNRRGTSGNPRTSRTNVMRIGGPESEVGVGTL
jgi:hypothetical protein